MLTFRRNRWHIAVLVISVGLCGASVEGQRKPSRKPATTRPAQTSAEEDRKAIEELHQQDIQASMAYDINALANLWDEEMVSLPPGQPALIGRAG